MTPPATAATSTPHVHSWAYYYGDPEYEQRVCTSFACHERQRRRYFGLGSYGAWTVSVGLGAGLGAGWVLPSD